jgi:hypothetical protein
LGLEGGGIVSAKHYDAVTRPALRKLGEAVMEDDLAAVKAAAEAAVAAGATVADILSAVGVERWNKLVRRIKAEEA